MPIVKDFYSLSLIRNDIILLGEMAGDRSFALAQDDKRGLNNKKRTVNAVLFNI
jgi:uncharacterized protein YcbX